MKESLNQLKEHPQFWVQVAIGGLLVWLSFEFSYLIFIVLVPMGYACSILKAAINGSEDMPSWGEVGEHLVNGVFSFALFLLFCLPSFILACFSVVPSLQGSIVGTTIAKFLWLGFFLLACGGFGLFLMSLARYSATGRFAAAFQLKPLLGQILSCLGEYGPLVLTCAAVLTFLSSCGGTLAQSLPFGFVWFVLGCASFLLMTVCAHATGSMYRRHFVPQQPAVSPVKAGALPPQKIDIEPEDGGMTRIRGEGDGWA